MAQRPLSDQRQEKNDMAATHKKYTNAQLYDLIKDWRSLQQEFIEDHEMTPAYARRVLETLAKQIEEEKEVIQKQDRCVGNLKSLSEFARAVMESTKAQSLGTVEGIAIKRERQAAIKVLRLVLGVEPTKREVDYIIPRLSP
jgi:hypothetical protein